jgi:F-type H+-transporting ATPase subunit epsilon
MAQRHFLFLCVHPSGVIFEGNVVSLVLPTVEGEISVLAGHEAMVVELARGSLRYTDVSGDVHDMLLMPGALASMDPRRGVTVTLAANCPVPVTN